MKRLLSLAALAYLLIPALEAQQATTQNPQGASCTTGISPTLLYTIPYPETTWNCAGSAGAGNGVYTFGNIVWPNEANQVLTTNSAGVQGFTPQSSFGGASLTATQTFTGSNTFSGPLLASTQAAGDTSANVATDAFVATQVQALAPYLKIGTSYYVSADGLYQATLPNLTSWTALTTQTGTAASAGGNGDWTYTNSSATPAFLADPVHTTSTEMSFSMVLTTAATTPLCGPYFWDSTNTKIWWLAALSSNGSVSYSDRLYSPFTGTGNPASVSSTSYPAMGGVVHVKGAVSGGTLTWYASVDGGKNLTVLTTHAVGTISSMGLACQSAVGDFFSILDN